VNHGLRQQLAEDSQPYLRWADAWPCASIRKSVLENAIPNLKSLRLILELNAIQMSLLTRILLLIALCFEFSQCSSFTSRQVRAHSKSTPMDWSGTYDFNASDNDFDSHLTIRFYPNRDASMPTNWMADGTIINRIIDQKITFKQGWVTMTETGPEIFCIHMQITPGFNDSGKKAFWIDDRMHIKDMKP
jgi:hypothetical protein